MFWEELLFWCLIRKPIHYRYVLLLFGSAPQLLLVVAAQLLIFQPQ